MNKSILAQYYDNHMMGYQDWGWGFMMMIFFFILVAVVTVLIVRSNGSNSTSSQRDAAGPLDIAKARYAKGEITKSQYDEIKKVLKP